MALAPRFGMAYDLTGQQRTVLRGGVGLFFDRPSGNSIYSQVQNPPTYTSVTVRNSQLQTLGSSGLAISGAPALNVFEYAGNLPSSTQWNGGVQMTLPWSSALDVEYVGQHSFNSLEGVDINAIDFGAAFLSSTIDPSLQANATPGATSYAAGNPDVVRSFRGYSGITQQLGRGWRTFHSLQLSFNRRFKDGLSFGFNDTIVLSRSSEHRRAAAAQCRRHLCRAVRSGRADKLLGTVIANRHNLKGNFVWDLPDLHGSGSATKALGLILNDWQLSGVWTAATGTAYTVDVQLSERRRLVNLTGSPNYGARIRLVGDPGNGCSGDPLRQFNTSAFQGPLHEQRRARVGRRLPAWLLHQCPRSRDRPEHPVRWLSKHPAARRHVQRAELGDHHGAQHDDQPASPSDPVNATNLPFDPATGNVVPARSLPRGAGFGVANAYQNPRTIQVQVRFSF